MYWKPLLYKTSVQTWLKHAANWKHLLSMTFFNINVSDHSTAKGCAWGEKDTLRTLRILYTGEQNETTCNDISDLSSFTSGSKVEEERSQV